LFFVATTVTACADVYKKPCKEPCSTTQGTFSYSLKINADTRSASFLEVYDNKGERILPEKVPYPEKPLPVKAIINVHTIIEAEGSCMIIIDGKVYNVCN
jgi:cytochrome b involved in lipid metabolism